jgi:hypothetical protein
MASEKWTRSGMLNSPSVWFEWDHICFAGFTENAGFSRKWEAAGLGGWAVQGQQPGTAPASIDLAADMAARPASAAWV